MQNLFSSPDEVVAQADQIVNVDLPAEDFFGTLAVRQNLSARTRPGGDSKFLHEKKSDPPPRDDAERKRELPNVDFIIV
jgi:hypothetical protein